MIRLFFLEEARVLLTLMTSSAGRGFWWSPLRFKTTLGRGGVARESQRERRSGLGFFSNFLGAELVRGFGGGLPNSGVRPSRASFTDLVSEASVNSMAVTLLAS